MAPLLCGRHFPIGNLNSYSSKGTIQCHCRQRSCSVEDFRNKYWLTQLRRESREVSRALVKPSCLLFRTTQQLSQHQITKVLKCKRLGTGPLL